MAEREQKWKRNRIGEIDRDSGRNRTGEGVLVAEKE